MEDNDWSVYAIIDGTNDFEYIGQTTRSVEERFKEHTKADSRIGYAIRAHGEDMFIVVVLKVCHSKDELDYWEQRLIKSRNTKHPNGYNLTDGGDGGTLCDEICAQISATSTGVPKSPEHCAAISAGHKGKFIGEKNHRFGKHHTQTARYIISIKQRADSPFKNLLAELDARQMSYAALAKLLGFASMSNLSDKMRCRKNFTERDKVRLVEIFGKPIEYLLARDEEPIVTKTSTPKHGYSPYKNLLAELDAQQLSYAKLAQLLGLSYTSVSSKMSGQISFTERDKVKLVEIFGKAIEYLLARD